MSVRVRGSSVGVERAHVLPARHDVDAAHIQPVLLERVQPAGRIVFAHARQQPDVVAPHARADGSVERIAAHLAHVCLPVGRDEIIYSESAATNQVHRYRFSHQIPVHSGRITQFWDNDLFGQFSTEEKVDERFGFCQRLEPKVSSNPGRGKAALFQE